MKKKLKKVFLQKKKRYLQKINGTLEKPRLSVFKSHNHIYAQLIDDKEGKTLACSSTLEKLILKQLIPAEEGEHAKMNKTKMFASYVVGKDLAQKAFKKNIKTIVFDRGNHIYQGRIKSLAEGSRSEGLIF